MGKLDRFLEKIGLVRNSKYQELWDKWYHAYDKAFYARARFDSLTQVLKAADYLAAETSYRLEEGTFSVEMEDALKEFYKVREVHRETNR